MTRDIFGDAAQLANAAILPGDRKDCLTDPPHSAVRRAQDAVLLDDGLTIPDPFERALNAVAVVRMDRFKPAFEGGQPLRGDAPDTPEGMIEVSQSAALQVGEPQDVGRMFGKPLEALVARAPGSFHLALFLDEEEYGRLLSVLGACVVGRPRQRHPADPCPPPGSVIPAVIEARAWDAITTQGPCKRMIARIEDGAVARITGPMRGRIGIGTGHAAL